MRCREPPKSPTSMNARPRPATPIWSATSRRALARRRANRALAHRLHGRDPRRAQRRHEAREQRHDGADEHATAMSARRDHEARARVARSRWRRAGPRSSGASPMPASSPSTEPASPIRSASSDHRAQDLPARRADRAQHPELPRALRDRDREGVEDDERADEQGDEPEDEQSDRQVARGSPPRSLRLAPGRPPRPVRTSDAPPDRRADTLLELGLRDARLGLHVDLGEPARLRRQRLDLRAA